MDKSHKDIKPKDEIQARLDRSDLKRLDYAYLKQELNALFHLEKGMIFTIKELLIRPGKTIRSYLFDNRKKYVKPIPFVIISALIYTFSIQVFPGDLTLMLEDSQDSYSRVIAWTDRNWGYTTLIISLSMAIWVKALFRKKAYNFVEILIALFYINAMVTLYAAIGVPVQVLFAKYSLSSNLNLLFLIPVFFYISWGIGQFFGEKSWGYLKGILLYLLGVTSFYIIAFLLIYLYSLVF